MAKGSDYIVEKKEEIRQLAQGGTVQTFFRIWATSKGGTYFHVDVPENALAKADEPLTRRAKELDSL